MTSVKWHLKHAEHGNKPWAVQIEALKRAGDKFNYAWFLEQGLGKTSLALNDFVDKHRRGLVDTMVVLCPNSFKADWAGAPAEWGVPEIVSGYHPQLKMDKLRDPRGHLIALNYEAARSGAGAVLSRLMRDCRVYLGVDESLALGTPSSDTTKAVIQLCRQAQYVRLLNGTPTARDVTHYYGQLKCLDELNGVNPFSFKMRYAELGGFKGKQVIGIRNEDELAKILARCSFRALKKDWRKDLPPQVFTHVHLDMTPQMRSHYREMVEEFLTLVNDDMMVMAQMVLTQMEKLRQIASGLAMQDGKAVWLEPPGQNPKVRATLDILKSGETKAIVSHYYKPTSHMLMSVLEDAGYRPVFIRGGEDPDTIVENKRLFNNDPRCRVLVAQQGATYRGHTLIGGKGSDRCNRMIYFENSFSYYQRVQMQDRIHRGAQDQECQYFDLITSPIEQVLVNTLAKRKDFADAMDRIVDAARLKV